MKALVIGYGSIGKRHINNLSKLPYMDIVVCTKQKKDIFLKKNNCLVINSLDESLKESPDFALICNETHFHISTAMQLAKNKIHFFVEKPLGDSLSGTKKLLELIKNNNLITLVGCNLRFHPCILEINSILKKNRLGKIISVRAENGSFLPEWHTYEDYSKGYAAKKNLGGGVVLTCIHELDYLCWLFGKVKNVISITGKYSELNIDVEDLSLILMQFKNEIVCELHLDYLQKPSSRYCKIIGTKGTLFWDFFTNKIKLYDHKKGKWITILHKKNFNPNNMYIDELNHFISHIQSNKQTMNPINEGIEILSLAITIKNSAKSKKMEKIN